MSSDEGLRVTVQKEGLVACPGYHDPLVHAIRKHLYWIFAAILIGAVVAAWIADVQFPRMNGD